MVTLLAIMDTFCGVILIVAGTAKLGSLRSFGDQIAAYNIVPALAARRIGSILPPAEIAVGVLVILNPRFAVASAGLFLCFAMAVGVNLLRGKKELHCGCFGSNGVHRISLVHVIANMMLVAAALTAFSTRPRVSFISFQIGTSVVVLLLLVSALYAMTPANLEPVVKGVNS